jgi:hypothetical protein
MKTDEDLLDVLRRIRETDDETELDRLSEEAEKGQPHRID